MPDDTPTAHSPLMKPEAAAKYLDVSPRKLRTLRQQGKIPTVWVSEGCPRLHVKDLDAYIEAQTVRARPAPKRRRRRS